MASTALSSGKTSSVKGKRYSHLPFLAASVMVSRSAAAFSLPLPPAASAPLRQIAPSRYRRTFRQSRGATAGSGLRLCVKDGLLQVCVLLATQGDNSRIRWSASQECQHVLSSDIKTYNKKLLGTSPVLLQEVALPANFMLRNVSTLDVSVRPSSEAFFFFGHLLPRFHLPQAPLVRQATPTAVSSSIDPSDAVLINIFIVQF
jgi:hypothetical protein